MQQLSENDTKMHKKNYKNKGKLFYLGFWE